MMAIIDGTGPWLNSTYAVEFARSYCKQTERALAARGHAVYYSRGPSVAGLESGPYARAAIEWISERHRAFPREPVYVMGYSRGGAAAVVIAQFLRTEIPDLRIEAAFLFDAVDRSVFTDAAEVPGNVDHCYHVIRDRTVPGSSYNRFYFDNDATEAESPCELEMTQPPIYGSHGAMGGTPWVDCPADPAAVIEVAQWMNARLARHGLPRCLDASLCYPDGSAMDRRVEGLLGASTAPGGMCRLETSGLRPRQSVR